MEKNNHTQPLPENTLHFHLDADNEQLIYQGEIVPLTPKAFAVLHYLVQACGRLVRKEALMDAVWPGAIVGDAALQVCIREIRKALNDSPSQPRFIQTAHRKGYRFIGSAASLSRSAPGPIIEQSAVVSDPCRRTLVERKTVLKELHAGLQQALQGQRKILFVTGEAGIGKTTLIREFCNPIQRDILMALGQCVDHNGPAEPYLPILDALGKLCRNPEYGADIVQLLQQYAPSWLLQMPSVLTLEHYQRLLAGREQRSQERMLREMAEALEAIAQKQPLILVLEDIHWCDHSTLDLLDFISRRQIPARLLIVANYRPVDIVINEHPLRKLSQSLIARGLAQNLALELFDTDDILDFLGLRFPGLHLDSSQLQILYDKTYGNPLFLEIFLNHLQTLSILQAVDGHWRLLGDLSPIGMPDNLRLMIEQQLQLLEEADSHLLKAMSVAGMRVNTHVIAAATGLDCDQVEQRCDQISEQQLFIEFDGIADLPDGTVAVYYQFKHALYQEVLYQQPTMPRKMRTHRAIAQCLETQYQDKAREHAVTLAIHFSQGRDYAKAALYWHWAAEQAVQRSAYAKAMEYIQHGLDLLPQIKDLTQRQQRELGLQMTLGPVLIANAGNTSDKVEHTYLRAYELSQQLDDNECAFPILFGLRSYYQFCDQLHTAHQYSQKLLNLTQLTGNEDFLLESYVALASTHYLLGELDASCEYSRQGAELYDSERHRQHIAVYGTDPGVFCRSRYAQTSWLMGYTDRAMRAADATVALAERIEHPYSLVFALLNSAQIDVFRRQGACALEAIEQGQSIATAQGFPFLSYWAHFLHAWALASEGQKQQATAVLKEVLRDALPASEIIRGYLYLYLAEIYYLLNMPKEGLAVLAAADDQYEIVHSAERRRLQGEFLLMRSDEQAAMACFNEAISISEKRHTPIYGLRAALSLARLPHSSIAHQSLRRQYQALHEGQDQIDLQEVHNFLQTYQEEHLNG